MLRLVLLLGMLGVAGSGAAWAEQAIAPQGDVTIRLKDGSLLVGRIVAEDEGHLQIVTRAGVEVRVPRSSVDSIRAEPAAAGVPDPNDTRLFFAPTGRPLRKGDGYFSDHYVFFPGVSFGITDHLTLMGGVSLIPGLSLDEQLFYVAPKIGARVSDRFALSVGYLYARAGEEGLDEGAGIGFTVATLGGPERSLTAGLGLAHSDSDTAPIIMLGGQARVAKRIFFLTENWLILGEDFRLSQQPFSAGLRFCGDHLSVDFGLVLISEVLEEGFPIPWLSFSYRFGPSGGDRAARTPTGIPLPARRAAVR